MAVSKSAKLCVAAQTCLLLLTTKTVTAIWPLAIYYQLYITVSEILVYSYWYNLAVISSCASCASCASGGPSWSCVNCRCNCPSVCVLDAIPHFLSIYRKNASVYVLNASVLLGVF